MPRTARARIARLTGLLCTVTLLTVGTGCSTGDREPHAGPPRSEPAASDQAAQEHPLDTEELEAALPNQSSVPADLNEPRTRKAWDTTDTTVCQSEGWPDTWCAQATALGLAGFTNLKDQELTVRLISFPDTDTAAQLFQGEGTPDEVGDNPPGDEIDEFDIEASTPTWSGKGINVREGAVTAKIEYTWRDGTAIPPERMQALTEMVVQRIQQAQNSEPPTASAR
ncbi:hypothetical protein STHAL_32965 [Streptomyces halstedii]|uniref:DUF3558 domain-containing protein n=1 Tax=Streptomyces halstedii TaxID=1944 RepID=A0ABS6U229_STRHA|nr:hypothetical protein [Streptomyces halstedii]MBV7674259.1 hypothetical protein [Streptomyces halstedii]